MIFRKTALAAQSGEYRNLEHLRQFYQLIPGAGMEHTLPGPDDGMLRRDQRFSGDPDIGGVSSAPDMLDRGILKFGIIELFI